MHLFPWGERQAARRAWQTGRGRRGSGQNMGGGAGREGTRVRKAARDTEKNQDKVQTIFSRRSSSQTESRKTGW